MTQDINALFINSQLREDFLLELDKPEIKVVSFDIFDTLLRRKCFKPKDIFNEVAKRAIANQLLFGISESDYLNIRINAENKARELSTEEDIEFEDIFSNMFFDLETAQQLKAIELQVESEYLFLDPVANELLQLAHRLEKRIVITSDMYLPMIALKEIINKTVPSNIKFEQFFVSSESKKTKTTGSQFIHISECLNVVPAEILHIGDNREADIKSAKVYGLNTLLFNCPKWVIDIFAREERLQVQLDINIYYARLFSALLIPRGLSDSSSFYYYYGCVINGPTLAGFSKWILSYTEVIGKHEVFCIMREGDIYEKCLKQVDNDAKVTKLYASRKSTHLASLNEETYLLNLLPALARNSYTLTDLYAEFELGVLPEMLQPFKDNDLFDLECISLGDKLVIEHVNNELSQHDAKIKEKIFSCKDLLNRYFEQERQTDLPFIFIDFGAGGTIQTQLHTALKNKAKANLLFYANDRAYKKTSKHHVASFLPFNDKTEKAIQNISRSPEILEIVLVGQEQTTMGYKVNNNACISPVQPDKSYGADHITKIQSFNTGVEQYFTISRELECNEQTATNREAFALLLGRLITLPTIEEATHLGKLTHEDNFGSDREYSIIEDKHIEGIKSVSVEKYWRQYCFNPMETLYDTPWPQGALTMVDSKLLTDFYRFKKSGSKHTDSINAIMENLKKVATEEGIIVYGAGEFFSELELSIRASGIKIAFLIDKKANFGNFKIKEQDVIPIFQLNSEIKLPVVIASRAFLSEIRYNILNKLGNDTVIISC